MRLILLAAILLLPFSASAEITDYQRTPSDPIIDEGAGVELQFTYDLVGIPETSNIRVIE